MNPEPIAPVETGPDTPAPAPATPPRRATAAKPSADRRKQALQANLARRKAQARARHGSGREGADG